jgi:hypothetical protein
MDKIVAAILIAGALMLAVQRQGFDPIEQCRSPERLASLNLTQYQCENLVSMAMGAGY